MKKLHFLKSYWKRSKPNQYIKNPFAAAKGFLFSGFWGMKNFPQVMNQPFHVICF